MLNNGIVILVELRLFKCFTSSLQKSLVFQVTIDQKDHFYVQNIAKGKVNKDTESDVSAS